MKSFEIKFLSKCNEKIYRTEITILILWSLIMDRRKWAVKLDDDVIVNFTNTTFPMSTFTVIVFFTASSASLGLSRVKDSFLKKNNIR